MVTQTMVDASTVSIAPETARPSSSPPRIADYRLLKHVGSGAFGDVWLAEEKHIPGVFRAVKVLHSTRPRESSRVPAHDDAAAARELRGLQLYETRARGHAHLVQVLHVGRVEQVNGTNGDDSVYYAMEVADHAGGAQPFTPDDYRPLTLKSLLRYGGRLSAERAIEYQLQLLDGLEHLHRNGLQHRDVKPANLLFVRGKLKLADLGLTSSDETRQFCGTVGYLPPESKEPDDLYAAGIVLYEMLTGMPASSFPEWPEDLDPGHDSRLAEVRRVFSRACSRDAPRRFPDAQSFKAALELSLASAMSSAESKSEVRRLRRLATIATSVCLLALSGLAWLGYEVRGLTYGFTYGRPPYDGSVAKLLSEDRQYLFEWSTSDERLAVPTNSDERHAELFDLEAQLNGSQLQIRGQVRCWSRGNPLPRRMEEAGDKRGEIIQVYLVLKTEELGRAAQEVRELAKEGKLLRGEAAREKRFETTFLQQVHVLICFALPASPGSINGFHPDIELASLGLQPNKSYPIFAFVTAAEPYEMYEALAVRIAEDGGLRIGSVQHTPNP